MHTSILASLATLTSLLTLTSSSPVELSNAQPQHPYFAVRPFSFSNATNSARYSFNVSFPEDVVIYPASATDPTFTIPGFISPVPCTGTWFYSPAEPSNVTLINACGIIGEDRTTQVVTSQLDVVHGILYLTYKYNGTIDGQESVFEWDAEQTGLVLVGASAMEGFNTSARGPGVEQ